MKVTAQLTDNSCNNFFFSFKISFLHTFGWGVSIVFNGESAFRDYVAKMYAVFFIHLHSFCCWLFVKKRKLKSFFCCYFFMVSRAFCLDWQYKKRVCMCLRSKNISTLTSDFFLCFHGRKKKLKDKWCG